MKKILLMFTLFTSVISVSAQGTWEKSVTEADELKGEEGGTVYVYTVKGMGSLIIWDWNDFQYRLISEHQFDINSGWSQFGGSYSGIKVLVGIYDDKGQLEEKYEMWLDKEKNRANRFVRTRNAGSMSNPVGQKKKVRKLFEALHRDNGYVRMVAPRFERTDFDIKITPYKE